MNKSDYDAYYDRHYDGTPYIDIGIPGASGPVPVEEARHLRDLLNKALDEADKDKRP